MNGWQLYALIVFLQATACAALALVAMRCFQRSAAARHAIGATALVFLALIPALTAVLPRAWFAVVADDQPAPAIVAAVVNSPRELPVEPPTDFVPAPTFVPPEVAMQPLPPPVVAEIPRVVEPLALPNPPPQKIAAAPASERNWLALGGNLAALVWGVGVIVLTSRTIRRGGQLRQLLQSAHPHTLSEQLLADVRATFPLAKLPTIVISDQLSVPCVLGCWRPRVVLPRQLVEAGTTAQLRQVLIHECAHIVRGDPWLNMLQLIVGIFYWPQPAVSWLNRELARAREEVVDNHVLQSCDSTDYAQTLLDLAEQASGPTWQLIPLGLFGRWTLEERIAGLLNSRRETLTHASRRLLVGAVLLFGAISFVLGGAAAKEEVAPVTGEQSAPQTKEPSKVADDNESANVAIIGEDEVDPVVVNGQALDAAGKPAANCNVVLKQFYFGKFTEATGKTNAQGRFRVRLFRDQPHESIKLTASNADQSQLAHYFFEPQIASYPKLFQLQLSPKREVQVKVLDKYSYPVVNAHAGVTLAAANSDQAFFTETATDSLGIARFILPTNCGISRVVAWKNHEGLDYRRNITHREDKIGIELWNAYPSTGSETLQLNGAIPVTVKVVDDTGTPLPRIGVRPGSLSKAADYFWSDLPFDQSREQITNMQGETTFAWIPRWQKKPLKFMTRSPAYDDGTASCDLESALKFLNKKPDTLKIVLTKLVPVRGHIRDGQRTPVANAAVRAYGQPFSGHVAERTDTTVLTNHEGAYELLVPPDKHYLVLATARGMAAAPQTGFAVQKNQPIENKDFTLRRATRIHGKMIDEKTLEPITNLMFWFWQIGESTSDDPKTKPRTHRFYQTDENGNFEFLVGDGEFIIDWWLGPQRIEFKIAGDAERELILKVDRKKHIEVVGTMHDKTGENAIPACALTGITFYPEDFPIWRATTNEKGEFRLPLYDLDTLIHAVSADKKYAGIKSVNSRRPTVALKLDLAGTIHGRLLQPGTSEPWASQKIGFAAIFREERDLKSTSREIPKLGASTTTAADGTFELTGVVPGRENQLELQDQQGETLQSLRVFQVVVGEDKDLGDITPQPPAKQNPPTPQKPEPAAPKVDPKTDVGKTEPAPAAPPAAATRGELPVVCRDEKGNAVPGARVRLFRLAPDHQSMTFLSQATADGEGLVKLTNIALAAAPVVKPVFPYDLELIATKPGMASASAMLYSPELPTKETVCVLDTKPAALTGTVQDEAGQPIKGVAVFASGFSTEPIPDFLNAVTDEAGKFRIGDLRRTNVEDTKSVDAASGTVTMQAYFPFSLSHPDYALSTGSYTAVPQEVRVTLRKPAIVEGRVIDAVTDKPLANVPVSAQGIANGWGTTTTDAAGRYRLKLNAGYYNIWAEAAERMPIAVKSRLLPGGETTAGADIPMMRGGYVVGRVIEEKPGDAKLPLNKLTVGHYGPARPLSSGGVTSTDVAADGTFRLHVASGRNYIYLMNGDASAFVDVADSGETKLDLRIGQNVSQVEYGNDPDVLLQGRLRQFHEQQLTSDVNRAKPVPVLRKFADTPTGRLLEQLEGHLATGTLDDAWLKTLKDIVDLGPAAVPELIAELDTTSSERMLRSLGFILRAIDDKRAVPALIRAIPRTLVPGSSSYGVRSKDPDLLKFAQEHDMNAKNWDKDGYGFARPDREIFGALQKLTGQKFSEHELHYVFLAGTKSQIQMKRVLFQQAAKTWAEWWEQHASEFVQDAAYQRVNLPALPAFEKAPNNPRLTLANTGRSEGDLMESIYAPNAKHTFHDLDTGRNAALPEKWRDATKANVEKNLTEITAWAAREGYDLMGTEYEDAAGSKHFALQGIGLRAWELPKTRWKKFPKDITPEELQREGRSAEGLLLHYDKDKAALDPKAHAPFLVITSEGTPVILNVGVEITTAKTVTDDPIMVKDHDLDPVFYNTGRRFGFQEFSEAK